MRSPGGGAHLLRLWPEASRAAVREHRLDVGDQTKRDHTFAFAYPDDLPGASMLEPVTRYRFEVLRGDGAKVGDGRFETLPAIAAQMPRRVAFGVASCHQPFSDDGVMHDAGLRMLKIARTVWERFDVKHVLWTGDQLYADYPTNQSLFDETYFRKIGPPGRGSLFDCTEEEVAAVYHGRYRRNWAHPDWTALLSQFPSYPILDDHEIADNYGSRAQHHTPIWRQVRSAATAAYRHYQHDRVDALPLGHCGPFDYAFEYGSLQGYVLDVRSMRNSRDGEHARVFDPEQLAAFSRWLNTRVDAPVLFVVVSVPPFFMPGWMSRLARRLPGDFKEDAHDRWMHPQFARDRRRMLGLLRDHQRRNPRQKVVLVAGDVHVGYVSRCDWRTDPPTSLHQFVSSSITHQMPSLDWQLARHVPRTHFALWDVGDRVGRIHLAGSRSARLFQQPVGGLNIGVIEVDLTGDTAGLHFRLFGEDPDRPDAPKCLFDVGPE